MHSAYHDIRSRIKEPPKWWDENAVPRYCDFTPRETANIYARECCLLHIECQGCGAAFKVCLSRSRYQTMESQHSLAGDVTSGQIHYGDPPHTECCAAGPTMNSVPRRVLEFWRQGSHFEWERVPELEVAIEPDWWGEED